MIRKIIHIDTEKCNGCGLCAQACHEGAIGMADGKACLLRDDYCDGLGDCLPVCPTGAITFTEREALEYNEAEVKKNMEMNAESIKTTTNSVKTEIKKPLPCGCPGTNARAIVRERNTAATSAADTVTNAAAVPTSTTTAAVAQNSETKHTTEADDSQLNQWPVQIKLVPANAPYFDGARLLVAADCSAYAYANFHEDFIKGKITLIGCPKLDEGDYAEKLTAIISQNNIKSVTIVRMEVPCCGGIENAVVRALQNCGKMIPWQVVTISTDGRILER